MRINDLEKNDSKQVKLVKKLLQDILESIESERFFRLLGYLDRRDYVEGIVHAQDVEPYLIDNKEINEHIFQPALDDFFWNSSDETPRR